MTHGRHNTGRAGAVDASAQWQEEATLTRPPQVVPQPARRTHSGMQNTHCHTVHTTTSQAVPQPSIRARTASSTHPKGPSTVDTDWHWSRIEQTNCHCTQFGTISNSSLVWTPLNAVPVGGIKRPPCKPRHYDGTALVSGLVGGGGVLWTV